jgi:hypothetical protein
LPKPLKSAGRRQYNHGVSFSVPSSVLARLILSFALAAAAVSPAHGQTRAVQDQQDLINWYYSATFGTGVYTAGDRSVAVVQLPISWQLHPVSESTYGLKLKVPVTFGFYDYSFDDAFSGEFPEQVSTVSVMPGLEWEIPFSRRWTVKPYLSAGYGQELSGKESAIIYDFGVKSRYIFGEDKGVEFALVGALTVAGYRPRGGPREPFGVLALGIDLIIPTTQVLFDREVFIGLTPIYSKYFNRLRFAEFNDVDNRLREQFEIDISIMSRRPWTLKYFDVDRVGLAFRSSEDVFGVSLFTSLPF